MGRTEHNNQCAQDPLQAFLTASEQRPEPETIDWDERYAERFA